MTRVIFWFGIKGAEAVWQPWSEDRRKQWLEKHPDRVCPSGSWKRVQAGYYLRCVGKESGLAEIARLLHSGGNMRQALRELERDGLSEVLGAGLTLVGLGTENSTMWRRWRERHGKKAGGSEYYLELCAHLNRVEFSPLPWRKGQQLGWLVVCPDEVTAAAWELALMAVHGVRRVAVCSTCGGIFVSDSKAKVCRSCKENKPKRRRVKTPRTRFLNLLAQDVRRGRLTPEERQEIKAVLEERGLAEAQESRKLYVDVE